MFGRQRKKRSNLNLLNGSEGEWFVAHFVHTKALILCH